MTTRNWQWVGAILAVGTAWLGATPTAYANLEKCGGVFVFGEAQCEFQPKEECMTECMTVAVETSWAAPPPRPPSATPLARTSARPTASNRSQPSNHRTAWDCACRTVSRTAPTRSAPIRRAPVAHVVPTPAATSAKSSAKTSLRRSWSACRPAPRSAPAPALPRPTSSAKSTAKAKSIPSARPRWSSAARPTETTGGAIFCDGQFLNAANLDDCADELSAEVSIDIDIDVDVEATTDEVDDTIDEVGDEVDEACAVTSPGSRKAGHAALVLFGLCALAGGRRVRRMR